MCAPTGHAERGPMTTFNDREKGFENKFAHDAEMQFRAHARSNKMLGLWAASLLGKTGADAEAYAMEVLKADFAEIGHGGFEFSVVARYWNQYLKHGPTPGLDLARIAWANHNLSCRIADDGKAAGRLANKFNPQRIFADLIEAEPFVQYDVLAIDLTRRQR